MDQTSPYSPARAILSFPITLMLSIGTGGATTLERVELLKERHSGFGVHRRQPVGDISPTAEEAISAAQDVAFIKSILKISAAELAKCIGVTRQSLYNWKAGSAIKDRNAERVYQLKAAATLIAQEDVSAPAHTLRRTLPGGKTLLDMIKDGADGRASAQVLVAMLRGEKDVQRSLTKRFSGRKAPPDPDQAFNEFG